MAAAHVEGKIEIDRSVGDVFDFVADERNEPRYNHRIGRAELLSDGPIGIGTCFAAKTTGTVPPVEMLIEVTDYERPRRIASTTHMAAMDLTGVVTFDPVQNGTRMHWSWELQPKGPLRLFGPVLARIGRHQENVVWNEMRKLLESERTPVHDG